MCASFATSNIPKITAAMNDKPNNERETIVFETYDLLHNKGDYMVNGNTYTIPRPASTATLREVRIRRFNPITKRGRDNYENLAITVKVIPYIMSGEGIVTYYPNHQLYINGLPFTIREYTAKFGSTKENTTRNINDCIIIPNGPIIFYNPNDSSGSLPGERFTGQLEGMPTSIEYSSDGIIAHIKPLSLSSGSSELFLIFNLYITTTDWFVFSVTPEDILKAWDGTSSAFSALVGHYINNFTEAYDIIKSVARGDRLVLLCDSMNNKSNRVYVEGDNSEPIVYKFVDTQPSQPYITVSIKTLREETGEKKPGDYILDILPNLYDAVVLDLDWVYERL